MKKFETEEDIFDFLNMEFKEPHERLGIQSLVLKMDPEKKETEKKSKSRNTTLKKPKKFRVKSDRELLEKFALEGYNIIRDLPEARLNSMLRLANDMYYNKTSILSDLELSCKFKNKAASPKTRSKFAILLPTTLPQAKSGEFFNTAFTETTNSGADVPNATIVTAIK